MQDPEVRASMTRGGTIGPPAITYLEQANAQKAGYSRVGISAWPQPLLPQAQTPRALGKEV